MDLNLLSLYLGIINKMLYSKIGRHLSSLFYLMDQLILLFLNLLLYDFQISYSRIIDFRKIKPPFSPKLLVLCLPLSPSKTSFWTAVNILVQLVFRLERRAQRPYSWKCFSHGSDRVLQGHLPLSFILLS